MVSAIASRKYKRAVFCASFVELVATLRAIRLACLVRAQKAVRRTSRYKLSLPEMGS